VIAFDDYAAHDGLGLAALVKSGAVSPAELLDAAVDRITALNPALNAVVRTRYDAARREARQIDRDAPFCGVPFLVKDLLSTLAGEPTGQGTRLLGSLPMPQDSTLVRRWRAAGLLMLGRTNTPEFGLTPYTEPLATGPARNPWSLAHTPGGSSGGSAAAVAARMVPVASGGDGGGSIRIPASCCGLFGLKPSRGATPTGPVLGTLWQGLAVEHVLSRSVRDSAALLDASTGDDPGAPWAAPALGGPLLQAMARPPGPLRIAFCHRPLLGQTVHADCVAAVLDAAGLLQSLGHAVEEASPPVDRATLEPAFVTLLAAETAADIAQLQQLLGRRVAPTELEPATAALGLLGRSFRAAELALAQRSLQAAARALVPFFQRYDMLLTPTLGGPPALLGAQQPTAAEQRLMRVVTALGAGGLLRQPAVLQPLLDKTFDTIPFTALFNITGQPAMSVPLCWNSAGLPIGVQLAGRFGEDALLLRLAGQLEQARPWFHRVPVLA
jgi:amidase